MGGETSAPVTELAAPAEVSAQADLTAGARRRSRSRKSRRSRRSHRSRRSRKASAWVRHAMAYAKEHGVSYKVALKKAGASYRRMSRK